ncbi:MAG TPA: nitroreductase family protein [Solirubrobacteraceae bacterium]|nr:nitroreductase family protein [Solirubrobacteraceae bacterium]
MSALNLSAEQVLTTTRAVRKRLDLDREVPRELIEQCIELAQQAPTRSNIQPGHFFVVADAAKRAAIADYYRQAWDIYTGVAGEAHQDEAHLKDEGQLATIPAVLDSARYLADNLERVPVLVIPCVRNRTDNASAALQSFIWGSILPSAWQFCLAARDRGLGTCWTTLHTFFEKEIAELLGIPFEEFQQVALIPVAYYTGDGFKPTRKLPLEQVVHWDTW